jgi:hypothetical protein
MSTVLGVRLTDQVAAAVDRARGTMTRSAWLQDLITRELARLDGPAVPVTVIADKRIPAGTATLGSGTRNIVRRESCHHPANRRIGHYCAACGTSVGKTG